MVAVNTEKVYWLTQKQWYRPNKNKDGFEILPDAPERVKNSFKMWNSDEGSIRRRGL